MWHFIIAALCLGYWIFIFWMLFDCVKYVEDRDERAMEALFIALLGFFSRRFISFRSICRDGERD